MSEFSSYDRRSNDSQVGYLQGKVEAMDLRLSAHLADEAKYQERISEHLERIEEQLSMYRHMTFFLRTLGVCLAAILAANWQEAKVVWSSFWHSPH